MHSSIAPNGVNLPTSSVHVLNSKKGRFQRKRAVLTPEGQVEMVLDAPPKWLTHHEVPLDGPEALFELLGRLQHDPTAAIVHGALRPEDADVAEIRTIGRAQDGDPPFLQDCPRRPFGVDVDHAPLPPDLPLWDVQGVAEYVRDTYLPESLKGAACWAQISSSTGLTPKHEVGLHFWFWSADPVTSKQLRGYFRDQWAQGYSHLDSGVYTPYCRLITSEPLIPEGIADPYPDGRSCVLEGTPTVQLPIAAHHAGGQSHGRNDDDSAPLPDVALEALLAELPRSDTHANGREVLTQACEAIRTAPEGSRNSTLVTEVTRIWGLVGCRRLDPTLAHEAVSTAAASLASAEPKKTADTIARAIRAGLSGTPLARFLTDRRTVQERIDSLGAWDTEERFLEPLELPRGGIVVLQADLGAGKTERVARLGLESVIAVCHSRALVASMGKRFGLPTHMEVSPERIGDGGLAICIDSLCRLRDACPAVLVIEESELTLAHAWQRSQGTIPRRLVGSDDRARAGDRAHTGEVYEKLAQLGRDVLAQGGSIIVADAFASERTRQGLKLLFGADTPTRWVQHQRPRSDYTIHRYAEPAALLSELEAQVQAGRRAYVCCTSRSQADLVARRLGWVPGNGGAVIKYTSEVLGVEREGMVDPTRAWAEARAVVASPTISAGLDFSPEPSKAFDAVFVFGARVKGIGWTHLIQMAARARGTKEIYAHVASPNLASHLPPTLDPEWISRSFMGAYRLDLEFLRMVGLEAGPVAGAAKDHWRMSVLVERERRLYEWDIAAGFYGWWQTRGARIVEHDETAAREYVADLRLDRWRLRAEYIESVYATLVESSEWLRSYREPESFEELRVFQHTRLADRVGPHVEALPHPTRVDEVRGPEGLVVRPFLPADLDRTGRLAKSIGRRRSGALLVAKEGVRAGRGALMALATGYPSHATGEAMKTLFRLELLDAAGVDVRALLGPELEGVTDSPNISNLSLNKVSDTSPAACEEQRSTFVARLESLKFTRADIAAAGINLARPWNTLVGQALAWFGEKRLEVDQKRDASAGKDKTKGNARVRRYRLDLKNHRWIAKLSNVSIARRFGARLDPLAPGWRGDEWLVAVDLATGWWRLVPDEDAAYRGQQPAQPEAEKVEPQPRKILAKDLLKQMTIEAQEPEVEPQAEKVEPQPRILAKDLLKQMTIEDMEAT